MVKELQSTANRIVAGRGKQVKGQQARYCGGDEGMSGGVEERAMGRWGDGAMGRGGDGAKIKGEVKNEERGTRFKTSGFRLGGYC